MVARAIESWKSSSKPPYGGRTRCALADAIQRVDKEIRLFLENHSLDSLEFHEIWHKNTLGNK